MANPHDSTSRTVFEGRIFKVRVERARLPHGRDVDMEVVRHPGSVVLLPMPDPDHVILIRQYRYVIDRWIWELPAGSLNPGEGPERAARRECQEELGLVPRRIERLAACYPTPGYCDEVMIFFRLTGLEPPGPDAPRVEQDEDENLEPQALSLDEARALVERGEIVDLKTIAGLIFVGR